MRRENPSWSTTRSYGVGNRPNIIDDETSLLDALAEGLSSPEIGRRLFVATSTVETHRRNVMRKLGIHSVADLTSTRFARA
ncbi:MAG TPA: helix-turn-helix transcriptional regulator [Myxococcota bacterium]|nr:helix-turn-helix transcriptional regulator [Myxococcota bacterium]